MSPASLVVRALRNPEFIRDLSEADWDLLIRQARRANLLAKLACRISEASLAGAVLPAARPHLQSARALASRQDIAIRWEVECIRAALRQTGVDTVLLKGAAYVTAKLPVAAGRLFSDIDILVPKDRLTEVESTLMQHGWSGTHHDAYYQRYYRRWMHEIPPLQHARRGAVIDVHHALLPATARIKAKSDLILAAAVTTDLDGVRVLAPADMILHSATHLFHEGEFDNGLRDLFDLDGLIRHFVTDAANWDHLLARARQVGLIRPLFYALRYARRVAGTPVPAEVLQNVGQEGPHGLARWTMDFCFSRALQPNHTSCNDTWTSFAREILYLRSHWLRMPLPLLTFHLTRKALRGDGKPATQDEDEAFHQLQHRAGKLK